MEQTSRWARRNRQIAVAWIMASLGWAAFMIAVDTNVGLWGWVFTTFIPLSLLAERNS